MENEILILDRYRIAEELLETPSGLAHKGVDTNFNREVIIKKIEKNSKDIEKRFKTLITTYGQIIHPNVITVLDYGEDDNYLYLIQEFIDFEKDSFSLEKIKSLSIEEKINILLDLTDALKFANESGIIHKNLYFDSIFLSGSRKLKIDNFNLDRVVLKKELVSELGYSTSPPPFIPPEKINGKHSTVHSDIFQIGCIIYTLFTGIYPFGENISDETIQKIKLLKYPDISIFSNIPENIKTLIKETLKISLNERINEYDTIIDLLKDTDKKSISISSADYTLAEIEDKIYVIVYNLKTSAEKIEKELLEKGYLVDIEKIKEAILNSKGSLYPIYHFATKINTDKFENVSIEITPDRLKCFLTLPANHTLSEQEILYFLRKNNIKYGIIPKNIKEAVKENKKTKILVAEGKPAINGHDAYIKYFFEKDNILKPKVKEENGQVDFKETNYIQPICKNEVLCVKIPYTNGIDGIDIFGQKIKAKPGKDVKLPVGKNTYISSDGLKLISTVDGQITFNGRQVNVIEVIIINQNVDYSVGNIRYHGDVIINGDVISGFNVFAGGDIKISGIVEGCNITSEKGEIFIKGGIFGKEKAKITALKKIKAEFVQDAKLICEQDIEIFDYVRNSTISCGGFFKCIKQTGTVHTCSIDAGDFIEINIAGTKPYTKTVLKITPLNQQLLKGKLQNLSNTKKNLHESITFIKEQLKKIILKYGNVENALLDKEYKLNVERLKNVQDKLELIDRKIEILQNLYERSVNHTPFIKINETLYTDVVLKIGNYLFKTNQDISGKNIIKIENNKLTIPKGVNYEQ